MEAVLKGEEAGKDYLARQYRDTALGRVEPHAERAPQGCVGPDPYDEDSGIPPTPRQLRPFLRAQGSAKTVAVLRRFRHACATHPIYSQNFELYLVSDLLDEGKIEEAITFRDYYRESGLECGKVLLDIAKDFQRQGLTKWAIIYYQRVLLLEPLNDEAADNLRKLCDENTNDANP